MIVGPKMEEMQNVKPRNKTRETKTRNPRRRVKFSSNAERSINVYALCGETRDGEDAPQERSSSFRVDLLEEVNVTSKASSL